MTGEPDRPRPSQATRSIDEIVADLAFEEWMAEGACVGADPDVFITPGDCDDDPWYPRREAVAYCNGCPVRVDCLRSALQCRSTAGVWGGTSEYQRRQLRTTIERRRCPVCEARTLAVLVSKVNYPTLIICMACGVSWEQTAATASKYVILKPPA